MPVCERCGLEHDGSFGSGRFCSRSCANIRYHSMESRKKVSETIKSKFKDQYGEGIDTRRQLRKYMRKQKRESIYLGICDLINTSDDVVFLQYPDIEFGNNYAICKNGSVISTKTGNNMSFFHRDRYCCVVLKDTNGCSHAMYVHRLVAYNFIPNPNNYPIVNHKDENPSNNNVDNLEWCTYQYNSTYNDAHIKRGAKLSETIRRKGGPWNKGMKLK